MPTTHDLTGHVALVTGAAGDIGRACAVRLAASGATVAAADLDRRADDLEETVARCEDAGGSDHAAFPFDVTDSDDVDAAIAGVLDTLGVATLLVNSAGYQGAFAPTHRYPVDDAARVMAINVTGLMAVTAAVSRAAIDAEGSATIVNIASHAGIGAPPNMAAYGASKAAVIGYTRIAAADLAPYGIRVNAVSPAFIGPGEMWDRQVASQAEAPSQYYDDDPATVQEQMIGAVPLRRVGSLDEVASVVVWLLSDDSSYVTGKNIQVTGGI